jgi:hypothetical protein
MDLVAVFIITIISITVIFIIIFLIPLAKLSMNLKMDKLF